jgi:hypothetical protein
MIANVNFALDIGSNFVATSSLARARIQRGPERRKNHDSKTGRSESQPFMKVMQYGHAIHAQDLGD